MKRNRHLSLKRRHQRVRQKVKGTPARPRLCVHRSLKHIYAQVINDLEGQTLVSATTNRTGDKAESPSHSNIASATKLGQELGKQALDKGVTEVVFDRGGYRYHGVVKAFADAAREAGLKF